MRYKASRIIAWVIVKAFGVMCLGFLLMAIFVAGHITLWSLGIIGHHDQASIRGGAQAAAASSSLSEPQ